MNRDNSKVSKRMCPICKSIWTIYVDDTSNKVARASRIDFECDFIKHVAYYTSAMTSRIGDIYGKSH